MMNIYYCVENVQYGPINRNKFNELIAKGLITLETYVRNDEINNWIQVKDSDELKTFFIETPSPLRLLYFT
jgi:hypothetical protein